MNEDKVQPPQSSEVVPASQPESSTSLTTSWRDRFKVTIRTDALKNFAQSAVAAVMPAKKVEDEKNEAEEAESKLVQGVRAVSEFLSRKKSTDDFENKDKDEDEDALNVNAAEAEEQYLDESRMPFVVKDNRTLLDKAKAGWEEFTERVASVFSKTDAPTHVDDALFRDDLSAPPAVNRNSIAENEADLERRVHSLSQEILRINAPFTKAILGVGEYLEEIKKDKLNGISGGILIGPSRLTKKYINRFLSAYRYSKEETKDPALQKQQMDDAVKQGAERWWTWGPLKLLRYMSPAYKAAQDKLVNDTRDYFDTVLAAEELDVVINDIKSQRETFNANLERYQKYLNYEGGSYIKKERFDYIFTKREEMTKLGEEVWRAEEIVRLNGKIRGLEKSLLGDLGDKEVYRNELEEDLAKLIEQRAHLVVDIREKQMIIVSLPELTYRPGQPRISAKMTEQEVIQQQFGELADRQNAGGLPVVDLPAETRPAM